MNVEKNGVGPSHIPRAVPVSSEGEGAVYSQSACEVGSGVRPYGRNGGASSGRLAETVTGNPSPADGRETGGGLAEDDGGGDGLGLLRFSGASSEATDGGCATGDAGQEGTWK